MWYQFRERIAKGSILLTRISKDEWNDGKRNMKEMDVLLLVCDEITRSPDLTHCGVIVFAETESSKRIKILVNTCECHSPQI